MNKRILRTITLLATIVAVMLTSASVDAKRKARTSSKNISTLAEELLSLNNSPKVTVADCQDLKQKIENASVPYFKRSYNKSAKTAEQKTKAVLAKVEEYAKTLENGATFEMANSGYLHEISLHYNTIADYEQLLKKATSTGLRNAIISEMEAWLKVEDVLRDYGSNFSHLVFLGGSLAYIGVAGKAWTLAELRDNDIKELSKIGFNAAAGVVPASQLKERVASVVLNFSNTAKELIELTDEDMKTSRSELFDSVSKGVTDASVELAKAFPQWIEARQGLLRYSKHPSKAVEVTSTLVDGINSIAATEE